MYNRKTTNRLLSFLLVAATLLSLVVVPSTAAVVPSQNKSLGDGSSNVTIQQGKYIRILEKSTGGTVGGSGWTYTSNDGITGPAYCVNWGLDPVSPSKRLEITGRYDRSPKTMGAFAAGYPQRTLEQFKELNPGIQGIENLTETEFAYATQLAIWATCGQLAVPNTSFTAGRASLTKPTSDAQKIRVYESVVEILKVADTWTRHLYSGLYFHMEKEQLGNSLTIYDEDGLEGASQKELNGIKKETINGKEYYTRLMYIDSATSTYPNDYEIYVYAMDAPEGTIMVNANNQVFPSREQWGATMFEVPSISENTSLNANGYAYRGTFKLCLPCDSTADSGTVTVQAYAVITQYNLYLANNPTKTEQSYIIADPAYVGRFAQANVKWSKNAETPDSASLQVQKVDGGAMPLEGAEFTLTGSKGTHRTGISDRNGYVEWTDLPADENYLLTESKAPAGFSVVAPRNITLTAGQTAHVTIQDDTSKKFTLKKIDKQNGSTLEGAVFLFEQIDGTYKTTAATGFDGMLEFSGDELPFGSYRISEERAPTGYERDTSVQTIEWDGTKDVLLTFQNVRQPTIIGSKVDGITGISLPNASFDVFKDGKKVGSVTSNDSGEFRFPIEGGEGYFEFVETIAPEGYVLDSTPHGIHVDPYDPQSTDDPVLVIKNYGKPALRLIKYDRLSHTPMAGVTFEIWRDGESLGRFETNESGEVLLYDLEPGTFRVFEVDTGDDGHLLDATAQEIELKAGDTQVRELVFFNDLKPGMHLIKVDSADLSKPIANAKFKFTAVDGSWGPVEMTTLEDGTIDLSKLPTGAMVVEELECPGYVIDDAQRIIELKPNEDVQFVFTNSKLPSLHLLKTSSDGTPLEGVSFRLAKIEDGTHYLDRTTSATGEILWEGLEPGVYSLIETATVSDHILDLREHHVELFPGKVSEIVLENHKRPNLIVYKNDADDGSPIEHTIFTVRAADGHSVDEIETDATGRAILENLLPGVYEISEKSVPSPWLMDAPSQLVTLYPDRDHTAYFKNHKRPVIEIIKENAVTFDPLANVPFRVWYASNNTTTGEMNDLGVFYTDENGRIELDGTKMGTLGLRDGWFRVQELEPLKGFAKADPDTQEAFIPAGQGHTFVFRNQPLSAICVWKYDSQQPNVAIEGAVFQIRYLSGNTSGTGGTVIGTFRTSANGSFTATGLQKGTYIIEVRP